MRCSLIVLAATCLLSFLPSVAPKGASAPGDYPKETSSTNLEFALSSFSWDAVAPTSASLKLNRDDVRYLMKIAVNRDEFREKRAAAIGLLGLGGAEAKEAIPCLVGILIAERWHGWQFVMVADYHGDDAISLGSAAAVSLMRMGDEGRAEIVTLLESHDPEARDVGATTVAGLVSPRECWHEYYRKGFSDGEIQKAVEVLRADMSCEVTTQTVKNLNTLNNMDHYAATASPTVVELLRCDDMEIKFACLDALAVLGSHSRSASEGLIEFVTGLANAFPVRPSVGEVSLMAESMYALRALGGKGEPAAPAVRKLLVCSDPSIRDLAKSTLEVICNLPHPTNKNP